MSISSHIPESIVPNGPLLKCLLEKLEETGTDAALIDCALGEIWNGHEVHESILRCSSGLTRDVGIKKGDVVCVYSGNSAIDAIAFLSIIAAGGIHISCGQNNTLGELLKIIVDTGASYVICSLERIDIVKQAIAKCRRNIKILVFANNDVIDSNGIKEAISFNKLLKYETKLYPVEVMDEDPAVLMMTSGTTGIPRLIIHSHKNLKHLAVQGHQVEIYNLIKGRDVYSGHIPLQHSLGCFALLHTICSNVPLALQPPFDPFQFMKYVDKYRITSAYLSPTFLIKLIDCPTPDVCDLSSLVDVVSGASHMPKHVPNRIRMKLPTIKLRARYGLTETACATIIYKSDTEASSSNTTVGKPFPGIRIKIVDPQTNKLQPIGSTGEICISGGTVTSGYYNSSFVHEELFVDETFFRTGDAGYFDADGNLYIVSRYKDIIKVGPVIVAPVELELILMSHDDVLEAAVIGISDEVLLEVPRAFVVLKKGRKGDEQTLIEFINEHVNPSKRLRGGVVFVHELPKSAIGKVQKSKLKSL